MNAVAASAPRARPLADPARLAVAAIGLALFAASFAGIWVATERHLYGNGFARIVATSSAWDGHLWPWLPIVAIGGLVVAGAALVTRRWAPLAAAVAAPSAALLLWLVGQGETERRVAPNILMGVEPTPAVALLVAAELVVVLLAVASLRRR